MRNRLSFRALMLGTVLCTAAVLGSSGDRNAGKSDHSVAQAMPNSLEVTTRVTGQSYCYVDAARDSLILRLRVRLTNHAAAAIILRKDGVVKAEALVSKDVASAERKLYEYRVSPPFISPRGVEPPLGKMPDERFVILKSGESYEIEDTLEIPVARDASRAIPGLILPGEHALQIKYFTWLDSQSVAERIRERWNAQGHLLTDPVVSEPMMFRVAPNQGMQICGWLPARLHT